MRDAADFPKASVAAGAFGGEIGGAVVAVADHRADFLLSEKIHLSDRHAGILADHAENVFVFDDQCFGAGAAGAVGHAENPVPIESSWHGQEEELPIRKH